LKKLNIILLLFKSVKIDKTETQLNIIDVMKKCDIYINKETILEKAVEKALIKIAIKNDNLDMLKYLCENKNEWNPDICAKASKYGRLEILKWYLSVGPDISETILYWDSCICIHAAENDHLECLKYAYEYGCPWNMSAINRAVKRGNLEIVKYLVSNDCPWSSRTCDIAVENNHLSILKYLIENGCPCGNDALTIAIKNNHLSILKYLIENADVDCYINIKISNIKDMFINNIY